MAAVADASRSLEEAQSRAVEIQPVVERILEHGVRNHIGARVDAAFVRRV